MAPFNPEVKDVRDEYVNRSRGVTVPDDIKPQGQEANVIQPRGVAEGNRAAEYEGKIAGLKAQQEGLGYEQGANIVNAIDASLKYGIGTTDALIKKKIEREVYDQVNAEREGYIEQLQGIKDKLSGPGPKLQSFLDANNQADVTPDELQDFTRTADTLEQARLQGSGTGRYRHTDYAANIHKIGSDLRNRYPGYKDYIDQQMERITGHKSANYLMAQLTGDINSRITGGDAMKIRALGFLEKYPHLPNFNELYTGVLNGSRTIMDVQHAIAPYEQRRVTNESIKWQRENLENRGALTPDMQGLAKDEVDGRVSTMANEAIKTFEVRVLGVQNKEAFLDFASKAGSGVYNPQQIAAAGQQLVARIPQMRAHMMQQGNIVGKNGRTLIQDSGGLDAYEKKVETALKPYQTYIETFYNGTYGLTGALSRETDAQLQMTKSRMVNDPDIGPQLQIINGVKALGGESNLSEIYLDFFKKGWDKKVEDFSQRYIGEFMAGTKLGKTGIPTTFNDFVTNGKQNGVLTNDVASTVVQTAVDKLKDAKIPDTIKYNLIQSMYSDGNLNFVEKLNKDGVDTKGRPILGTYYTYNQMTSPEVTQEVARLAKAKPELWKNYTNWATTTFRNLYVNELKTLQEATEGNDNIKVHWLSKEKKFHVVESGYTNLNDPANKFARQQVLQVKSQVQKLNDGLGGLKEIATAAGRDENTIEAYLFQTMYDAGWSASEKIQDLPSKFMQEIIRGRMAEEAQKASRKKLEEKEGKR